jgi:predicted RNA-binding Zn ribbon-like protein
MSSGKPFLFVGNCLWLDFVNTEVMGDGERVDLLGDFSDLVRWARTAGFLTAEQANLALGKWGGRPAGRRALDAARAFRAVLRRLAERLAAGGSVQQSAVEAINGVLRHKVGYSRISLSGDTIRRAAHWEFDEPGQFLAPVAESAAEILTSGDPSLVRKCKNPACILFFYDTTKNHARSWCRMSACGNRTKVAAHYRRRREAEA